MSFGEEVISDHYECDNLLTDVCRSKIYSLSAEITTVMFVNVTFIG